MWAKQFDPLALAGNSLDLPGEPDLLLTFGPTDALQGEALLDRLAACYPNSIQLCCSTGTVVTSALCSDDDFSGLALGFEHGVLGSEE